MPDPLLEALAADPLYQALRRASAARREQIAAGLDVTRMPAGGAGELRARLRDGLSAVLDATPADLAEDLFPADDEWPPDDVVGLASPPPVGEAVVLEDDGEIEP